MWAGVQQRCWPPPHTRSVIRAPSKSTVSSTSTHSKQSQVRTVIRVTDMRTDCLAPLATCCVPCLPSIVLSSVAQSAHCAPPDARLLLDGWPKSSSAHAPRWEENGQRSRAMRRRLALTRLASPARPSARHLSNRHSMPTSLITPVANGGRCGSAGFEVGRRASPGGRTRLLHSLS